MAAITGRKISPRIQGQHSRTSTGCDDTDISSSVFKRRRCSWSNSRRMFGCFRGYRSWIIRCLLVSMISREETRKICGTRPSESSTLAVKPHARTLAPFCCEPHPSWRMRVRLANCGRWSSPRGQSLWGRQAVGCPTNSNTTRAALALFSTRMTEGSEQPMRITPRQTRSTTSE